MSERVRTSWDHCPACGAHWEDGDWADQDPAGNVQCSHVESHASSNSAANEGADYVIADAIRRRIPDFRMPELMAWDIIRALEQASLTIGRSIPNRVQATEDAANAVLAGADEIPNVLSDDNPNVWKSGRVTPNRVAEQIVAARNAIRAIAKSDGVDADSFSMATAAYEALHGRKLTNDEVDQALDLAFRPEQWS